MARYSLCKSCGASVRWVTMPGGKSMPIDTQPSADGNVFLHSDGVRAAVLKADELAALPPDTLRYKSHFATCSHPERHRKA